MWIPVLKTKASDEVMTSRGRHHKLHYPDILVNTFLKGLRSQALITLHAATVCSVVNFKSLTQPTR